MSQAQQTYNNSQGQTNMPATYAGASPTTEQALGAITQRAQNGSPLINSASQSLSNIMQPGQAPGTQALQGLTQGVNNPGNATAQYFADPNNINPYLDAQFKAQSQPVMDAVNSQFGMGGRTGSTANQNALTTQLGNLAANIYAPAYENAANRALSASDQLSSNAFNNASVVGGAANSLNSNANTQNQQAVQASIAAPNIAGQDYTDLQNMLNAGQGYDSINQNILNSAVNQWQYGQQQPWNILSGYAGAVSGLGGVGGTTSGSSTQPSQSMIPQLAGTAISMLPFLMSDERLKEDITRIGTAPNGLGIYSFRFKGIPRTEIGLIAQEVRERNPDAVLERHDGYLMVDYARALAN